MVITPGRDSQTRRAAVGRQDAGAGAVGRPAEAECHGGRASWQPYFHPRILIRGRGMVKEVRGSFIIPSEGPLFPVMGWHGVPVIALEPILQAALEPECQVGQRCFPTCEEHRPLLGGLGGYRTTVRSGAFLPDGSWPNQIQVGQR